MKGAKKRKRLMCFYMCVFACGLFGLLTERNYHVEMGGDGYLKTYQSS